MKDPGKTVREKYKRVAEKGSGGCSCCDNSIFGENNSLFHESYSGQEGYVPGTDHFLGCGIPTGYIRIGKGDHVVDLGSGAGNDCFIARHHTGESGKVTGIDFTPAMTEKARQNALRLGFSNVEFICGDIADIPLGDECADVVISNCVLNLVPDKQRAFAEIFRILKPKGSLGISDMVVRGRLPQALLNDETLYAGCISGASERDSFIQMMFECGFEDIRIRKEVEYEIPAIITGRSVTITEKGDEFGGLFSITVTAFKPGIVQCNNYNYSFEDF